MKWIVVFLIVMLCACSSRKRLLEERIRKDVQLELELASSLKAQLRVLELLDIDFRQVEKKDSSGNIRTETVVKLHRDTKATEEQEEEKTENRQETDKSKSNRQEKEDKKSPFIIWGKVALLVLLLSMIIGGWLYLRRSVKNR